MKAKIAEKKEIAEGTLMVKFKVFEDFTFTAGQYFFINLRGETRHFSIVNSPNEKGVLTMTTRLRDSAFKKSLKELPIDTEVEIQRIAGKFTLPEDKSKPLVFIAGGIGITPFMSMLRFISEQKLDYKITLIYSNKAASSTAYLEELKTFESRIPDLKLVLVMTDDNSWTGEKRRVDANLLKEYFPQPNMNSYMVVGPPAMVEAVEKALLEAGVSEENIKIENFTGY